MYTVIVADDEVELRRSLIARTPWEECGFQVIGEAANGVEALELVEKLEPDLLLTDIRMPYLSGIALARQVREIRPATHIAFLSGYDDFTYAQQAIHYNIISYLLKPISSQELASELKSIYEKIDFQFREIAQSRAGRLHPHDFIIPLLLGAEPPSPAAEMERALHQQAVDCGLLSSLQDTPHYAVLATTIQDADAQDITSRTHVPPVERVLKKYLRAESCFIGGRVLSLIAAAPNELAKYLHIAVSEIGQRFERVIGGQCTIGVSREVDYLSNCHAAYREAIDALSYAAEGAGKVHFIADLERGHAVRSDYSEAAAFLEGLVKGGNQQELEAYLDSLFQQLREERRSLLEIDLMMVQLLAAVCRSVSAVVDSETANALWSASPLAGLSFSCRSLDELQGRMTAFCVRANDSIVGQCRESGEVLCGQALAMIESHFHDENLSLVSISQALHISPNYLSALIRKNTGETFINLLIHKRMETARELLQCTPLKVMEIAARCGYSDQHYFSYCFKKCYGVSPIALRRQAGAEGGTQA